MGRTVILTASAGTFPGLVEALREIPIAVEERPLLSFSPPRDWAPVDAALSRSSNYGAVAFTSPRAARAVIERLEFLGLLRRGSWIHDVWAVGPATSAALENRLGPVRLPAEWDSGKLAAAAALARAMLDAKVKSPVLFPCGETRRDELAAELRKGGVEVNEVICYRSILADESEARETAARGSLLVVASPTVVNLLARACPRTSRPELLAVGPTTAASAQAAGWAPAAVAAEPSARALASAIRGLLDRR
jgi:uroporphyrinogen III methyltransferase/synthase